MGFIGSGMKAGGMLGKWLAGGGKSGAAVHAAKVKEYKAAVKLLQAHGQLVHVKAPVVKAATVAGAKAAAALKVGIGIAIAGVVGWLGM